MKFSCEIEIKRPCQDIVEIYKNVDNRKNWQQNLVSTEHLQGESGKKGAQRKLVLKREKQEKEMTETIIKRNLPQEFHFAYETKGIYNIQNNFFEDTPENYTRWTIHSEFKFSGIMKLAGPFMRRTLRKQVYQYMNDFKTFAEKQISLQSQ